MLQEEANVILYKLLPIYWFHLPCFIVFTALIAYILCNDG